LQPGNFRFPNAKPAVCSRFSCIRLKFEIVYRQKSKKCNDRANTPVLTTDNYSLKNREVMKTKRFAILAFALLLATAAMATKLPTMKVTPVEAKKTLVSFESETPAQLEVTIKDPDGNILYYKKTEEPVAGYQSVFDFAEAGNGSYTVSLTYGNCTLLRQVTMWNKKLEVGDETRLFAPVFSFSNNLLSVSFFNQNCKNVFLNIYQNGEYVAGKKLGKEMCIQKAMDFSKLKKGTYDVVLSNQCKDYEYIVSK
jgi:hypothetical protein